jgi:superfamily II helicase
MFGYSFPNLDNERENDENLSSFRPNRLMILPNQMFYNNRSNNRRTVQQINNVHKINKLKKELKNQNQTIIKLNEENKKPLSKKIQDIEKKLVSYIKENKKPLVDKLKELKQKLDSFKSCKICFESYTNKRKKIILSCNHSLCNHCNKQWLQNELKCPFCKMKNPSWKIDHEILSKIESIKNTLQDMLNTITNNENDQIKNNNITTNILNPMKRKRKRLRNFHPIKKKKEDYYGSN